MFGVRVQRVHRWPASAMEFILFETLKELDVSLVEAPDLVASWV
jgi:hypothetical protein